MRQTINALRTKIAIAAIADYQYDTKIISDDQLDILVETLHKLQKTNPQQLKKATVLKEEFAGFNGKLTEKVYQTKNPKIKRKTLAIIEKVHGRKPWE